jgi:hypothetical protein
LANSQRKSQEIQSHYTPLHNTAQARLSSGCGREGYQGRG